MLGKSRKACAKIGFGGFAKKKLNCGGKPLLAHRTEAEFAGR
jgi:hypothetical protein